MGFKDSQTQFSKYKKSDSLKCIKIPAKERERTEGSTENSRRFYTIYFQTEPSTILPCN